TKERHCTPHDICEEYTGLIVKTQGNATHNTVCQCRAGMHCSDTSCQTCVENQPCKQGFGFTVPQTSSPCEPCPEGTFSNVSSKTEPCYPWTSCEEKGLVVKEKGTNTSDVICGKCPVPQAGAVWSRDLLHGGTPLIPSPLVEAGVPREMERQEPKEDGEDIFPVQETLLGGQPVAQEDGKESRISEQEGL
uniref:TNFR-Cys domain-containing protein n=1 Tax=Anas platyrhynchos platyrhynchos TaxID=8840 RepID=A0A493TK20_ANAPP